MKPRYLPAVLLLLLGCSSILAGTVDSWVGAAVVFWALGPVLVLAAAGAAANTYRKANEPGRRAWKSASPGHRSAVLFDAAVKTWEGMAPPGAIPSR